MDLYDPPPHLLSPEPVRGGRRGWGHGWVTRQRGATWSHLGNKGNGHGLTPESATSLLCNFGRAWSVVWASVFFYWRQGQTLGSPLTVHKGITGGKLAGATPQSAASGGPAWTQQRLTHPGPADCRQAELTGSQLWRVLRHEGRGFGLAESSCWRLSEGKHPVLTAEMKWCSHLLKSWNQLAEMGLGGTTVATCIVFVLQGLVLGIRNPPSTHPPPALPDFNHKHSLFF